MHKLKVRDLKEGMAFTAPLLSDDGEIILPKGTVIKRNDLINWGGSGIITVYTQGEAVDDIQSANSVEDRLKSRLEKRMEEVKTEETTVEEQEKAGDDEFFSYTRSKTPAKTSKASATKEDLRLANIYEAKIGCMEVVEQVTENLTLGFNTFLRNPQDTNTFKEKLISSSEAIVKGVKQYPSHYLDVVTFHEFGSPFISHCIRVAIVGTFIGRCMESGFKRLLTIAVASLLHDIGKTSYHIVNELEGIQVSKEKMNLHLTHPVYGYKTAKLILKLQEEACQAILNHHEQPDGKGFPRRVGEVKLFTTDKIVYIANVFIHLVEKGRLEGYFSSLQQFEYLLENFPEKFDHNIAGKLQELKKLEGYQSLQSPQESNKE